VGSNNPSDYARHSNAERALQQRDRATSLFIIQSIVNSYGGVLEVDLADNTLTITVKEKDRDECVARISEAMEQFRFWGAG